MFEPDYFYQWADVSPHRFVQIIENKTFAGKAPPPIDETIGRVLSVVWYEGVPTGTGDYRLDAVSISLRGSLDILPCTVAELQKAAGIYFDVSPEMTARDVERRYAELFFESESPPMKYMSCERLWPDTWTYLVGSPIDMEVEYLDWVPSRSHTKLMLARQCVLKDGGSIADWKRLAGRTKAQVLGRLLHGIDGADADEDPVVVHPAAVAVPIRGRGRGYAAVVDGAVAIPLRGRGGGRRGRGRIR